MWLHLWTLVFYASAMPNLNLKWLDLQTNFYQLWSRKRRVMIKGTSITTGWDNRIGPLYYNKRGDKKSYSWTPLVSHEISGFKSLSHIFILFNPLNNGKGLCINTYLHIVYGRPQTQKPNLSYLIGISFANFLEKTPHFSKLIML